MTDLAGVIRRVEPRHTAKLVARGLGVSERHAKRIVAGDIPRSRYGDVCRWLALRLDRRLAELAIAEADVQRFRGERP